MELLAELTEQDVGAGDGGYRGQEYKVRKGARAVLLDEEGKVALLHAKRQGIYKLPGGGVDKGETIEEGLLREVREEAGCDLDVTGEVGLVIEYRNALGKVQLNYCFLARVSGVKGVPAFTESEVKNGFELVWVSPEEALRLVKEGAPSGYAPMFMQAREVVLLEKALRLIS